MCQISRYQAFRINDHELPTNFAANKFSLAIMKSAEEGICNEHHVATAMVGLLGKDETILMTCCQLQTSYHHIVALVLLSIQV